MIPGAIRERHRGMLTREVVREAGFAESLALIHALVGGRAPVRAAASARRPG